MKRSRWQILAGLCTAALLVSGCSGNETATAPVAPPPAAEAPADLTRPAPVPETPVADDFKIPCLEDILRMQTRLSGEEWDAELWLEYGHDMDAMMADAIGETEELAAMGVTNPEELCAAYHDGRLEALFESYNN